MVVGRKIAINLHRMWVEDKDFDPKMDVGEFFPEETRMEIEKKIKTEKNQVHTLMKRKTKKTEKKIA